VRRVLTNDWTLGVAVVVFFVTCAVAVWLVVQEIDDGRRIEQLERPTDAQVAAQVDRALVVCARTPKCRAAIARAIRGELARQRDRSRRGDRSDTSTRARGDRSTRTGPARRVSPAADATPSPATRRRRTDPSRPTSPPTSPRPADPPSPAPTPTPTPRPIDLTAPVPVGVCTPLVGINC
jgi:hypothetical protein